MRTRSILFFILVFGFILSGCAQPVSSIDKPETGVQRLSFYEFYSPMWATCREVLPIVHGLEKEYGDRIDFVRVNIHKPENKPLMDRFGFTTTPELYLVDNQGNIIGSWADEVTKEDLAAAFSKALNDK